MAGSIYCGFQWDGYLYNNGSEYTEVGGISTSASTIVTYNSTVVKNTASITLTAEYYGSAGAAQAIAYTAKPIKITRDKLTIKVSEAYAMGVFYAETEPSATTNTNYSSMFAPQNGVLINDTMISSAGTYTYDLTLLKDKELYIGVVVCGMGTTRKGVFTELYLHN